MKRPLALLVMISAVSGCVPKSVSESQNDGGTQQPATVGACELAAPSTPVQCPGTPARLSDLPLGQGFLKDVWSETGLDGAVGRRVTFADVNNDGFPDFFSIETGVTRGLQHLWMSEARDGGGRQFVDVTAGSGITENRDGGEGQTALMFTLADVDNDGDLDLFSGSYSQESSPTSTKYDPDPNELYLNDGTGHFKRVDNSGVSVPWPLTTAAAVFLDYNLDGKLDLFVGNFMENYPTLDSYQSDLYRGNGDGTFTRVTDQAGLSTPFPIGSTDGPFSKPVYGVTACDYNDDGQPDLLVSSYALMLDDLWKNVGGVFINVSDQTNFAQDDGGNPQEPWYRQGGNTFSAACGDYDNDGDIDVFNSETTHGDYPRSTADRSRILVNGGPSANYAFTRPPLEATGINRPLGPYDNEGDHGASWFDLDNDGLLDLVIEEDAYPDNHLWIFHQRPDHTFEDVTQASGASASMLASNGLTLDDYDRDGDIDILTGSVNNVNGVIAPEGREQLHLYENQIGNQNHWLHVTLHGTDANKQGIGAKVTVTAGCLTQTREIYGGKGTFGAQDPAYAHFGLGTADRVDRIEVRWPTNPPTTDVFENVQVNQFLEITQGQSALKCSPAAK